MSLPPNDLIVKFDVLQHRVVQKGKKKYVVSMKDLLVSVI